MYLKIILSGDLSTAMHRKLGGHLFCRWRDVQQSNTQPMQY